MKSLGLHHVKAFEDTGDIEFAPITLFVGKNSSGKSSFIRFPVVLSQSFDNDISTIYLHSNAPETIDYGNFQDVLYQHQGDSFSFSFTEEYEKLKQIPFPGTLPACEIPCIIRCTISFTKSTSKKAYEIVISDFFVEINDSPAFHISYTDKGYIVLINRILREGKITEVEYTIKTKIKNLSFNNALRTMVNIDIDEMLNEIVSSNFDGDKSIMKAAKEVFFNEYRELLYENDKIKSKYKKAYGITRKQYLSLKEAIIAYQQVANFQYLLGRALIYDTHNMHYIGPFRNNPQRIYRLDESNRKNVGHSGEYTSDMLINDYIEQGTLTKEVSTWFKKSFGYAISVHELKAEGKETGYYQITLQEEDSNEEKSIMDVGYGISQVLPIVTQLAAATTKKTRRTSYGNDFFVIEQPELHLHPAAQAELATLFVNAISNESSQYRRILVETHSEHLIRALQVLIADPDCFLTQEMVKVYSVEKDAANGSVVHELRMTEEGQFIDEWPAGFFDKAYELSRNLLKAINKRNISGD